MQSYSSVEGRDSAATFLSAFPGNQQANQMDNDALAILGRGPSITHARDGIRDIHIIEKVLEAAKSGTRVELRTII